MRTTTWPGLPTAYGSGARQRWHHQAPVERRALVALAAHLRVLGLGTADCRLGGRRPQVRPDLHRDRLLQRHTHPLLVEDADRFGHLLRHDELLHPRVEGHRALVAAGELRLRAEHVRPADSLDLRLAAAATAVALAAAAAAAAAALGQRRQEQGGKPVSGSQARKPRKKTEARKKKEQEKLEAKWQRRKEQQQQTLSRPSRACCRRSRRRHHRLGCSRNPATDAVFRHDADVDDSVGCGAATGGDGRVQRSFRISQDEVREVY